MMAPEAKEVRMIRVEWTDGKGTEDDPCRRITSFYYPDGTLAAIVDHWKDDKPTMGLQP